MYLFLLLACLPLALCCDSGTYTSVGIQDFLTQRSTNATESTFRRVALNNVRYFDDQGLSFPTTVIINGPRIGPIGNRNDIGIPVEEEIDCTGKVLLPGLFDSHVHPVSIEDIRTLTRYGVTTAIGAACPNGEVCKQLKNLPGLASFITAGPAIFANGSPGIRDPSEAPLIVANSLGNGSDLIKIATAKPQEMSQEVHNALVRETHRYGVLAMTHATLVATWEQAAASGTDLIHHSVNDTQIPDEVLQRILELGIVNVPTLTIHRDYDQLWNLNGTSFRTTSANAKRVFDAGIPILVGTDAHSGTMYGEHTPFGLTLAGELELLFQAGLDTLSILQGATSRPAEFFSFHDRGRIGSGLRADLLLINGDPIQNISNVRNVERVWVAGEEFEA